MKLAKEKSDHKRKFGPKMAVAWKLEEREGRGFCLVANKSLLPGLILSPYHDALRKLMIGGNEIDAISDDFHTG